MLMIASCHIEVVWLCLNVSLKYAGFQRSAACSAYKDIFGAADNLQLRCWAYVTKPKIEKV